jgi:hypothetical protein
MSKNKDVQAQSGLIVIVILYGFHQFIYIKFILKI